MLTNWHDWHHQKHKCLKDTECTWNQKI